MKLFLLPTLLLTLLIAPQIVLAHEGDRTITENLEQSNACAASLTRNASQYSKCLIRAQSGYLSNNNSARLVRRNAHCERRFETRFSRDVAKHPGTQCDAASSAAFKDEAQAYAIRVSLKGDGKSIPGFPAKGLLGATLDTSCYSFDSALDWIKAGSKTQGYEFALFMHHPQDTLPGSPGSGKTAALLQSFVDNERVAEIQVGTVGDAGYKAPGSFTKYCLGTVAEVADALAYTNGGSGTAVKNCMDTGGFPVANRLDDIQGTPYSYGAAITEIVQAFNTKGVPLTSGVIGGGVGGCAPTGPGCGPDPTLPAGTPQPPEICKGYPFASNGEFANHTSNHENFETGSCSISENLSGTTAVIQANWSKANTVVIPPQNVIVLADVAHVTSAGYDVNSVVSTQCAYVPASLSKAGIAKMGSCPISPGASGVAKFAAGDVLVGLASLPATGVFGDENFFAQFQCNTTPVPPAQKWGDACESYVTKSGDGLFDLVNDQCPEVNCGGKWASVIFTDAACSQPHTSTAITPPEIIYHECSRCN